MIRRVFDVIVAVVALTTVALPLLVIAGIVKIASPGPVLFRQARVGRRGVPFALYKFRTMRCSVAGALVTAAGDDRIYPWGDGCGNGNWTSCRSSGMCCAAT